MCMFVTLKFISLLGYGGFLTGDSGYVSTQAFVAQDYRTTEQRLRTRGAAEAEPGPGSILTPVGNYGNSGTQELRNGTPVGNYGTPSS